MSPRIAARGLIVDDDCLLTVRYQSDGERWYLTPGGEQERGENLSETVRREVHEETGYEVSVQSLAFVRDFIPSNHLDHGTDDDHRVDHFFWCKLVDDEPKSAPMKDPKQVGFEWLSVESLTDVWFFPCELAKPLQRRITNRTRDAEYLGDIP